MPINLRYKLECSHAAQTTIRNEELRDAYRKGMKIECPQCAYEQKKIVEEFLKYQ